MLSYPKGHGQDKVLKYVDLPLIALAAEAEGLDLRILYLSRSAVDVVTSTTKNRHFDSKGWVVLKAWLMLLCIGAHYDEFDELCFLSISLRRGTPKDKLCNY